MVKRDGPLTLHRGFAYIAWLCHVSQLKQHSKHLNCDQA